jgi:hypothetical protein
MRIQQSPSPAPPGADRSIGTLWTLTRGESTARCVLLRVHGGLELRVLMDDSPLRAERCGSHRESFALAGRSGATG